MSTKKLIILHAAIFFGILITFSLRFNYPFPISILSILIIASFYLFINIIIGLIGTFTPKNILLTIASILYTITTCFILLIFSLNFIGNSNWGTNVTFAFIQKYASQLSSLESTFPVPLSVIYTMLIIITVMIFTFYFKVIHYFSTPLTQLFKNIASSNGSIKEGIYLVGSILMIPILLFFHQNFQHPTTDDIWDGEPFTDLFLPYTTITHSTNFNNDGINNYQYPVTSKNSAEKPNVIIIIADALRADHVGIYGYDRLTTPFIDNLVNTKKAVKIENAFSTCSESGCGILSTLGSRPYDEISRKNIKINNILKAHDYDVNFILSADHSWGGLDEHYPPYDLFYDGNSSKKYGPTDDQLVLEKLAQVSSYKKPTFFYFHLMSNHPSGMRKRQFEKYTPTLSPHKWFYNLPIIRNLYDTDTDLLKMNNYDNGVVSTDYYISQIFNQLTKKGYMNNSIVWIISDHGEALGEHGKYGHVKSLYNEETRIPMIIVDSQLHRYKETFFSTHMDIAPTILDRLDIKIPESWKGSSLLNRKIGVRVSHHNIPARSGDKGIVVKTEDNQIYKMFYNDRSTFEVTAIFNITKDLLEKNDLNTSENKNLVDMLKAYAQKNPYLGKIAGGLAEANTH